MQTDRETKARPGWSMRTILSKNRSLLEPGATLSQRVARGSVWVFTTQAIDEVMRLVRLVILARLLAPNDFGLMGIALLTMGSVEALTKTGFKASLIYKKGNVC